MARKLKKKSKPEVIEPKEELEQDTKQCDIDDLVQLAKELQTMKEKRKLIESRERELKSRLDVLLTKRGNKDTKGSYALKLNLDGKDYVLKKEARKSVKLNYENAENLFRDKGLWDFVSETKEVINEGYVEQAVLNGKLTMEELESVTDVKTSYAVLLKDYKCEEEEATKVDE